MKINPVLFGVIVFALLICGCVVVVKYNNTGCKDGRCPIPTCTDGNCPRFNGDLGLPEGANMMNCPNGGCTDGSCGPKAPRPIGRPAGSGTHIESYVTVDGPREIEVPDGYHSQFVCGEYKIAPIGYEWQCNRGVCKLIPSK